MSEYIYITFLAATPFFAILGKETDMTNFYILNIYICFCIFAANATIYINKLGINIGCLEVLLMAIVFVSFGSSITNNIQPNSYVYSNAFNYIILIILSKPIITKHIHFFHRLLTFNIIILNILFIFTSFLNSDIIVNKVSNTGIAAIFIAISACTFLNLLYKVNSRLCKILLIILLSLNIFTIFDWRCRTAFLIFLLYLVTNKNIPKRHRIFCFILTATTSLYIFIGDPAKIQSTIGRLFIIKNSLILFITSPFIGNGGLGSFCIKYPNIQANYFATHEELCNIHLLADNVVYANNEYMHFLCETGIIGFIIICCLIILINKGMKGNTMRENLFFPIIVSSIFYYTMHIALLFTLFLLCIMTSASSENHQHMIRHNNRNLFLVLLIFSTSISCYSINHAYSYKRMHEQFTYKDMDLQQKKDAINNFCENKFFLMEVACSYNNTNTEIYNRIEKYFLHSEILFYESKKLIKIKKYDIAEQKLIFASNICPNRFRYKYELLKLYKITRNTTKTKQTAENIMKTPIKIMSPIVLAIKKEAAELLEDSTYIKQ